MEQKCRQAVQAAAMREYAMRKDRSAPLRDISAESRIPLDEILSAYPSSGYIYRETEQVLIDELERLMSDNSDGMVNWFFSAGDCLFGNKKLTFRLEKFLYELNNLKASGKYADSLILLRGNDAFQGRFCRLMKSVLYVYQIQHSSQRDREVITATSELAAVQIVYSLISDNRFSEECRMWKINGGKLLYQGIIGLLQADEQSPDKQLERPFSAPWRCSNGADDNPGINYDRKGHSYETKQ